MIGLDAAERLAASRVTVVGLGAVGSYAVEGLARAGVGSLRLVDFDCIQPSNINRQLYALESTLGREKCEVAAARVREINPDCRAAPVPLFVHAETMDAVLCGADGEGPPDLVIDAIDSLAPKVELLAALRTREIGTLSSMGAALRTDPTSIRVGPLEEVHNCPLASRLKKRLRRRGVPLDIPCVYSIEPARCWKRGGAIVPSHEPADEEQQFARRGRPRNSLGSLPTLTGIFGLILANEAIRRLLGGFAQEQTEGIATRPSEAAGETNPPARTTDPPEAIAG